MRMTTFCIVLAVAAASVSAASADPYGVYNGPIYKGPVPFNSNAACTAGFTAQPATITQAPYNQSYVCTAQAIVCSPGFSPLTVYLPPSSGQLVGPISPASPITLEHGHPMYTCVEPRTPPQ